MTRYPTRPFQLKRALEESIASNRKFKTGDLVSYVKNSDGSTVTAKVRRCELASEYILAKTYCCENVYLLEHMRTLCECRLVLIDTGSVIG